MTKLNGFKLNQMITEEEKAVMYAVANGQVCDIYGGDTRAINNKLVEARKAR